LVWLLTGLPALLRERGVDDALIERLTILNPRRGFRVRSCRRGRRCLKRVPQRTFLPNDLVRALLCGVTVNPIFRLQSGKI
jgi:hypothetical protein